MSLMLAAFEASGVDRFPHLILLSMVTPSRVWRCLRYQDELTDVNMMCQLEASVASRHDSHQQVYGM